jgi:uncharacterized membrane protein
VNDPATAIYVVTTSVGLLSDWAREASAAPSPVRHPRPYVEPLPVDDLLNDAFRWIARHGAGQLEVQLWLQKAFAILVAQDEARFGAAARRLSAEALERADTGPALTADRDELRRATLVPS